MTALKELGMVEIRKRICMNIKRIRKESSKIRFGTKF